MTLHNEREFSAKKPKSLQNLQEWRHIRACGWSTYSIYLKKPDSGLSMESVPHSTNDHKELGTWHNTFTILPGWRYLWLLLPYLLGNCMLCVKSLKVTLQRNLFSHIPLPHFSLPANIQVVGFKILHSRRWWTSRSSLLSYSKTFFIISFFTPNSM